MNGFSASNFWSRVVRSNAEDCWAWQGAMNNSGYGTVVVGGRPFTAHRVAAWLVGLVTSPASPSDRKASGFILHSCDNPACCNPGHMRVGTYAENQLEAYSRGRRKPKVGHTHANSKLTPENVQSIRRMYRAPYLQTQLARMFGVSQRTISLIVRRETYIGVEYEPDHG